MANKSIHTEFLKSKAKELGFMHVGVSRAEYMEQEAKKLENWLNHGFHGKMSYLENHFDKRVDPTKLVPGAKSVITLTYNYFTEAQQQDESAPKIAMYAYGRDYHKVVKKKCKELFQHLQQEIGAIEGRFFVDSAPVLERDWAKRSGVGWIGKNTLLLNKDVGSYFFLAEIICDVDFEYDPPTTQHCGTCTKCIDACPTDAIAENGFVLDAQKCISYLTIELKDKLPDEFQGKMENWAFGCDICQDVCPWNRFAKSHTEEQFVPKPELLQMSSKEWQDLSQETFDYLFEGSAVKRTKYEGLKRNIDFLTKIDPHK